MQGPQCQHQSSDTAKCCDEGMIGTPYVNPDIGEFFNSPESILSQWTNVGSQVRLPLLP